MSIVNEATGASLNLCHKSRIRCALVRKGVVLMKSRLHSALVVGAVPTWRSETFLVGFCLLCIGGTLGVPATESRAIEVSPTDEQVEQAVEQGLRAAKDRVLPNRLYTWFGSDEELRPKGFLMTKMDGLTVMASHFGLRGETPSETEIRRILAEETMLVSVTIFGETPTFANDSYIVLKQGEKLVKPLKVRFDGVAQRTKVWPKAPRYRAKVIGSFQYDAFDAKAKTTIMVFPSQGDEASFDVEFASIP